MTSSAIEKIKPIIDFSLVSKFDTNDMLSEFYIPICVAKGFIYVLATSSAKQNNITSKISKILSTDKINIKVISDTDFSSLFSYIKSNLHLDTVEQFTDKSNNASDENMIQLKYDDDMSLEDEGLSDLQMISGNDSPSAPDEKYYSKKIGEVLVQMGFVTKEQIFNALVESKKSQIPLGTVLVQQGVILMG